MQEFCHGFARFQVRRRRRQQPRREAQLQFTVEWSGDGQTAATRSMPTTSDRRPQATSKRWRTAGARRFFADADLATTRCSCRERNRRETVVATGGSRRKPLTWLRSGGRPRTRPRVVGIVSDIKFRGRGPAGGSPGAGKDLPAGVCMSWCDDRGSSQSRLTSAGSREMDGAAPIAQIRNARRCRTRLPSGVCGFTGRGLRCWPYRCALGCPRR